MKPVSLEHFRGGGLVDGCDDLELGEGLPGFHHHGPLELELSGLQCRKLVVLVKRHLEVERLALVDLLGSGEARLARVSHVEKRLFQLKVDWALNLLHSTVTLPLTDSYRSIVLIICIH